MNALRLRDDVWLQVQYDDTTPRGSLVSGRMEALLRERADAVISPLIDAQWRQVDHLQAYRALRSACAEWYADGQQLRSDFLYPPADAVVPCALQVHTVHGMLGQLALPLQVVGSLADWAGDWHAGRPRPASVLAAGLYDGMVRMGAMTANPPLPKSTPLGVTWVGHACVGVVSQTTRVVVDPFLPAHDAEHSYRPLSLSQLAPNLVLVTHSHPDHFDLGTLLRLGADCDIVVPCVPRESALSIDMAARLQELGFRKVHRLPWHSTLQVGDTVVRALPFYGEQPGDGDRLHVDLRNIGNLYTVQTPNVKVAFSADAGFDVEGDLRDVAAQDAQRHGPVDVVFAGCRAWSLYPVQLLRSSVRRYALFVPPALWGRRHQLMAGAHEALDTAESWGAAHIVPYADGGAPWFWSMGLGPDLSVPGGSDTHFDPPPEALIQAVRHRSSWGQVPIASAVNAQIMRPGAHWCNAARGAAASQPEAVTAAQQWPYPRIDFNAFAAPRHEELVAVGRKKALLRVLAGELATQRGVAVSPADVQSLSNHLRRVAGLTRREDMMAWLAHTNLSLAQFTELMQEWARCNAMEALYAQEVDRRLPGQLALHAMGNAAAWVAQS